MGYTNLTDIAQFIPPFAAVKTQGTWTPTLATNVITDVRTADATAFTVMVPLPLLGSQVGLQGAKIVSIDVWYRIATAAATDFATVSLVRQFHRPHELSAQAEVIPTTLDTAHDSAAKRLAMQHHKMTVNIDTPIFVPKTRPYYLVMVVDPHANTVFSLVGFQANLTLRL